MTDILGYGKYAVHGTDWGSGVAYSLYDNFNASVHALHLNFLPFFPLSPAQLESENITLTPEEEFQEQRGQDWSNSGNGYFVEQTTRVRTSEFPVLVLVLTQLFLLAKWNRIRTLRQPRRSASLDRGEVDRV